MYKKSVYVNEIKEGKEYCDVFKLSQLSAYPVKFRNEDMYAIQISDKSGVLVGYVSPEKVEEYQLRNRIGQTFEIRMVALLDKKMTTCFKVRDMVLNNDCSIMDIEGGLSPEKIVEYKQMVYEAIQRINVDGYRELVSACLTEDVLDLMATYPATLTSYGAYAGGALAATCSVTFMAMQSMLSYSIRGNGMTTLTPNWALLITASLLHQYAKIFYYDEENHFKKSVRGVTMNYLALLQLTLQEVRVRENISMTELEFAELLNVLTVGVSKKCDTAPVGKEGIILSSVLHLYARCDLHDLFVAQMDVAEDAEYSFEPSLGYYFLHQKEVCGYDVE